MIYFLRNPKTKLIKIGTTKHFYTRLNSLNKQHKTNLKLLGWIEGGRKEEQTLHTHFSENRALKKGEWFFPSPKLLDFISANCYKQNPDRDTIQITIHVSVEVATALKEITPGGVGIVSRHVKSAVNEYLQKHTGKFYGL